MVRFPCDVTTIWHIDSSSSVVKPFEEVQKAVNELLDGRIDRTRGA